MLISQMFSYQSQGSLVSMAAGLLGRGGYISLSLCLEQLQDPPSLLSTELLPLLKYEADQTHSISV
jgi:hypothetical protein